MRHSIAHDPRQNVPPSSAENDPYNPSNTNGTLYDPDEQLRFRIRTLRYLTPGQDLYSETIQWLVNHLVGMNSSISSVFQPVMDGLQDEGATKDQLEGVEETLREEILKKFIWMLADVVDRPARVFSSLLMLVDVAQTIHGIDLRNVKEGILKESVISRASPNLIIKGKSTSVNGVKEEAKSVDNYGSKAEKAEIDAKHDVTMQDEVKGESSISFLGGGTMNTKSNEKDRLVEENVPNPSANGVSVAEDCSKLKYANIICQAHDPTHHEHGRSSFQPPRSHSEVRLTPLQCHIVSDRSLVYSDKDPSVAGFVL